MHAKPWLRLEACVVLAVSILAYRELGASWWWFAGFLFAPDVSMLGYLAGRATGAWAYNLAHTYILALGVAGVSWPAGWHMGVLAGVIWTAHIALDRALGYGLKSVEGFSHTHLGTIGRRTDAAR
jgi:hypothetical protein